MPGIGGYRDNFPLSKLMSSVYTRVRARLTANTPATVWDPGAASKFVLKGYQLSITCTTTADGNEVAGNMLSLIDHNANAPLITLGVLWQAAPIAGSHWPGAQKVGTATNTFLAESQAMPVMLREGYKSATVANILKFALIDGAATPASVCCSAGVFILNGIVWGDLATS